MSHLKRSLKTKKGKAVIASGAAALSTLPRAVRDLLGITGTGAVATGVATGVLAAAAGTVTLVTLGKIAVGVNKAPVEPIETDTLISEAQLEGIPEGTQDRRR